MDCNYCGMDLMGAVDGNDAIKIDSALRSAGEVGVRHTCGAITKVRGTCLWDTQPDEHQRKSLSLVPRR